MSKTNDIMTISSPPRTDCSELSGNISDHCVMCYMIVLASSFATSFSGTLVNSI